MISNPIVISQKGVFQAAKNKKRSLTESSPSVIIATRPHPVKNRDTSRASIGTDLKTPAEIPLFGVLIIIFEVSEWQQNVHINPESGGACACMAFASACPVQMAGRYSSAGV
jgi:hypothetical protein